MTNAFNARFVSALTPDRLYRVYVDHGEMFFIKVGGQGGLAAGVALQFGVLGGLLLGAHNKREEAKLAAKAAELDRTGPGARLSADKHNFHATYGQVERSSLEPPASFPGHGPHCGRWRLKLREGKEMIFQFESVDDMRKAFELLPSLGRVHANKVVYDSRSNRFTKALTGRGGERT